LRNQLAPHAAHFGCGSENNMKNVYGRRWWQLLLFTMLMSGSLLAESSGTLYPGWGTTLNGKPVYFSVRIIAGDHIDTANEASTLTFGGVGLEIAPDSTMVVGDSLVLGCGTIVIRSGKADISDGKSITALAAGEMLHSASPGCGDTLPDAPSAVRSSQDLQSARKSKRKYDSAPAAATGGLYGGLRVENWSYWTVNGAMFGSSLAAAEFTHTCLQAGACTFMPDTFHSRKSMFEVGMPALVGVSYLDFYLKKKGYRWWFIPPVLVTVGDIVVATHAAHYSH
jgi:hypothetical protein